MWLIGAIFMILFGATGVALSWYWSILAYAIVGGILLVVGILWVAAMRRSGGPLARNL